MLQRRAGRGIIILLHFALFVLRTLPENCHEIALELVSWANLRCVLHLFSSLTCLKGSWGQLWPTNDSKQPKTRMIIFHRGLTATKLCFCGYRPLAPPGDNQCRSVVKLHEHLRHHRNHSAELSRSLKVPDRRRNTPKSAQNRSAKL